MLTRISIFVVYTAVYFFFVFVLIGFRRETLFFGPVMTWLCLFVAICLTNSIKYTVVKLFFIAMMLIHYFGNAGYLIGFMEEGYLAIEIQRWKNSPIFYGFLSLIYMAGQVYIWSLLFVKDKNKQRKIKI